MLNAQDAAAVERRFGCTPAQVERDWAVAQLLSAIAEHAGDTVRFFGGTALSYTALPDGRLSEDIDLWAQGPRPAARDALAGPVTRALGRILGPLEWIGDLAQSTPSEATGVRFGDDVFIQIQLLPEDHYPAWPTELRPLHRRYRDAPAASLRVPTVPAFIAWKTVAWIDRRAPRDLWDLWALAKQAPFDSGAHALFREHGQFPRGVRAAAFSDVPDEQTWRDSLAHQTRLAVTAAEAGENVRHAWAAARS